MAEGDDRREQLWGRQYPFERNNLQRTLTLLGLSSVFAVAIILLSEQDVGEVLGISLIGVGLTVAMAALSRLRYLHETRVGFLVLQTRDGRFVFVSAAIFVLAGALVALLVVA